jgi:hypothetical protein
MSEENLKKFKKQSIVSAENSLSITEQAACVEMEEFLEKCELDDLLEKKKLDAMEKVYIITNV